MNAVKQVRSDIQLEVKQNQVPCAQVLPAKCTVENYTNYTFCEHHLQKLG